MSKGEFRDVVPPAPTRSEPRKRIDAARRAGHLRTHVTYPQVYLVAVGDMTEGFVFYGPFKSAEIAVAWAVDNLKVGESVQIYPMSHVRGVRGEVEAKA